jgi:hypothetical protein
MNLDNYDYNDDDLFSLIIRNQQLIEENRLIKEEIEVLYNVINFMRESDPDIATWGINENGDFVHLFTNK